MYIPFCPTMQYEQTFSCLDYPLFLSKEYMQTIIIFVFTNKHNCLFQFQVVFFLFPAYHLCHKKI